VPARGENLLARRRSDFEPTSELRASEARGCGRAGMWEYHQSSQIHNDNQQTTFHRFLWRASVRLRMLPLRKHKKLQLLLAAMARSACSRPQSRLAAAVVAPRFRRKEPLQAERHRRRER
jgi:hypothetical protein